METKKILEETLLASLPVARNQPMGFIPLRDPCYLWDKEYLSLLNYCFENNKFLNIIGPPGCGKTSAVKELCAHKKKTYIKISVNGDIDVPDIVGQQCIGENGQFYWRDGRLTAALKQGNCLILLDEINFMRPEISAAIHSLLDEGDGELHNIQQNSGVKIKDDTIIFATMNPSSSHYSGTNKLNPALLDRFHQVYKLSHLDPDAEIALLISKTGVKNREAHFIAKYAQAARHSHQHQDGLSQVVSTRWLLSYCQAIVAGLNPKLAFTVTVLNRFNDHEAKEAIKLYDTMRGS